MAYTYRVEVSARVTGADPTNQTDQTNQIEYSQLLRTAHQLGITTLTRLDHARLFFLSGTLTHTDVERLAYATLVDPVTETCTITTLDPNSPVAHATTAAHQIEITPLPGVTDAQAESLMAAAHLLQIGGLQQVVSGQLYRLWGDVTAAQVQQIATRLLANPVVQRISINQPISHPFVPAQPPDATVETIAVRHLSDDDLLALSQQRRLALDLAEMQAIRSYFLMQERDPTDAELEMLAQTWSEHCVHKTFKALIEFELLDHPEVDQDHIEISETIDGLLRSYIRAATDELARPWVHSAFVDNAGVIAFNEQWDLAFKVETHNRPSALDPFGGAHTGVGGVIRDVLGVSARPIANTNILCFGMPDTPDTSLPQGVLHPRRIAAGVVHGIEDYGNKMGIPTVNGAIYYHPGYTANPLVFCGCLGLLPRGSHPTRAHSDDLIVVLGGRTGRDGLRGATFSSMELDASSSTVAGSAVQIGNPITEKQVQEVVLAARDARLYHAITDCGAGGLASAVGEMGRSIGASVDLTRIPLKYAGLRPWEIWLSEAQERMVMAVAPEHLAALQAICARHNVEASVIGTFTPTGRMRLTYGEQFVADLAMDFLHDGLPRRRLKATHTRLSTGGPAPLKLHTRPETLVVHDLAPILHQLLAHPNIRSKADVIHRYDHEVQGGTVVKPLVGHANQGPSDAAVIVPLDTLPPDAATSDAPLQGVALSVGLAPSYSEIDPYEMAWSAIDEAIRNAVCVGADPARIALLDNFCWGNPNLPDRLGSLVRCVQGCYDAAIAYGAPFISGKDSLNNEYVDANGNRQAIPGTLVISAVGIVPDVRRSITMDFKQAGNAIYIIGSTRPELGGSHYLLVQPELTTSDEARLHRSPQPVTNPQQRLHTLHQAIQQGLVQACHDCSEGGIGVAVAEMCIASGLGAEIELLKVSAIPYQDAELLFSETLGRFIVEVRPEDEQAFRELFADLPHGRIGIVHPPHIADLSEPRLHVLGQHKTLVVDTPIAALEASWRGASSPPPPVPVAPPAPVAVPSIRTSVPRILILHANGTNRDREAALACHVAGGAPEIVHVNQIVAGERHLSDYQMLVLPGGFSYGDDLGAGRLWALDLEYLLHDQLTQFAAAGKPILGICNGFQALVKAGLLPGSTAPAPATRTSTLTYNASAQFECRWVYLHTNPASPSLFTRGLTEPIYCPVAHGEGRFVVADQATLAQLEAQHLIALRYANPDGSTPAYPANPNGSVAAIAGICNPAGTILGLMPHPEDHIFAWQHPRWRRGEGGLLGLHLFSNAINALQEA